MTPSDHRPECRDHPRRRVGYPSVGAKTPALAPRAAPIGQYNCPHQSGSTTALTNSNQAPRTNTTGSLPALRVSQPFTSPDATVVNHHRPHPLPNAILAPSAPPEARVVEGGCLSELSDRCDLASIKPRRSLGLYIVTAESIPARNTCIMLREAPLLPDSPDRSGDFELLFSPNPEQTAVDHSPLGLDLSPACPGLF